MSAYLDMLTLPNCWYCKFIYLFVQTLGSNKHNLLNCKYSYCIKQWLPLVKQLTVHVFTM